MEGNMFPEMRSMNLKTFSKLFLIPGFWILINGLAAKLPHFVWPFFKKIIHNNDRLKVVS